LNTSVLFGIIYNVLIIMYLNNLEDKSCNCIMDWRHNYIKYFCGVIIILEILTLIINIDNKSIILKIFSNLLVVLLTHIVYLHMLEI